MIGNYNKEIVGYNRGK